MCTTSLILFGYTVPINYIATDTVCPLLGARGIQDCNINLLCTKVLWQRNQDNGSNGEDTMH